jgi:hypothetical protein
MEVGSACKVGWGSLVGDEGVRGLVGWYLRLNYCWACSNCYLSIESIYFEMFLNVTNFFVS